MFNPLITATAGWSEAVELRAKRLLDYRLGTEEDGFPVTVATMFAQRGEDPVTAARLLMLIQPMAALRELSRVVAEFHIDGEPCPDAFGLARQALSYAGRAVYVEQLHPERQFVANLLAFLFGLKRPSAPEH